MKDYRDIGGGGRRRLPGVPSGLLAGLLVGFLALATPARAFGDPADDRLRKNYLHLKIRFETLARRNSDPVVLTCLAVETTALTWTLAAAHLAEPPETRAGWRARADEFEKSWSASRDWDNRHRLALQVYYESLREVALALAAENNDPRLAAEIQAVSERVAREEAGLAERPNASLEKVTLSGGLVGLTAALVRTLGGGALDQPADLIVQDVAEETEATLRRDDLHYRARLAFLYASNVQGLTDLVFLLGRPAGPPLNRDLAEIHLTLNKAGADTRLPTTVSLAWIAQTQAALPLAYWLATRPRPAQG